MSKKDLIQHFGMMDTGTAGNFIFVQANVKMYTNNKSLKVVIPDGSSIHSTHECDIDWSLMLTHACHGHNILSLVHQSLIPIV